MMKNRWNDKAGIRLNRYLAACGLGSRRKVEELIKNGKVFLNGSKAESPGLRVCSHDRVVVDGLAVEPEDVLYVLFNKPQGFVCSVKDPHNRTVFEILPREYTERGLFPVGRLDKMSEGLILLTNDGETAFRLTHPGEGTEKTYDVLMSTSVGEGQLKALRKGTSLDGKHVRPLLVVMLPREPKGHWVRFVLNEGVKREIRRLSKNAGLEIRRLVRTGIGKMKLEKLKPGEWREISKTELFNMIEQGGIV
ncbi:MAG: pseudouridine synthase [Thermovirgaceae bacterium]